MPLEPNDLANLLTVGGAALCSVLLVVFKSRCTRISCLYGLWACDRAPTEAENEPEPEPEPLV